MPTVTLATIKAEADREYGDLKIAMTDELDSDGEPVDFVALRNGVRLPREQRNRVKELQERFEALEGEPEAIVEQQKKVNTAQNRLDAVKPDAAARVRSQLVDRVQAEQDELDRLRDEHAKTIDVEAQERDMRSIICDMVRAVSVSESGAERLIESTKTELAPEGDLPYLMAIFRTYMDGDQGEASPSES